MLLPTLTEDEGVIQINNHEQVGEGPQYVIQ